MLGRIQHKNGQIEEAESLYREALQIRRSVDDDDDETIANALSYIGSILQQRGELDDAEAMQREALSDSPQRLRRRPYDIGRESPQPGYGADGEGRT